jgi:predicted acylesterase/phospholipase RssA
MDTVILLLRADIVKSFVCAASHTSTNTTARLRSYKLHGVFGSVPSTIVQAALATSAATGYFDAVNINGERFADGALLANNPAAEAFEELKSIHRLDNNEIEDRICCFVSIGTGHPGLNPLSDKFWEMIRKDVLGIVTETQLTADRFREAHKSLFNTGRAFRFNVMHGMEKFALDEWKCADKIMATTRAYLADQSNNNDFNQCGQQLVKAVGMLVKEDFS